MTNMKQHETTWQRHEPWLTGMLWRNLRFPWSKKWRRASHCTLIIMKTHHFSLSKQNFQTSTIIHLYFPVPLVCKGKVQRFIMYLQVTSQAATDAFKNRLKTQMTNECGRRVYLHISIRAGLSAAQGSALGHGDAALTHLTAKIVPLVSHRALQGAVSLQFGAGVIWKSWSRGHLITGATIHQMAKAVSHCGAVDGNIPLTKTVAVDPNKGQWLDTLSLLLSKLSGRQISLTSVWANVVYVVCLTQEAACQKGNFVHTSANQPLKL